jgi:hypothetical protein
MMIDGDDRDDQQRLARDLFEVHGNEAQTVARGNARAAALAGQPALAKSWIRVLGIIQRQQAGQAMQSQTPSQIGDQRRSALPEQG